MTLRLDSPVNNVKGVGAKYLQILKKNGIFTVFDLLLHFPVLYIDFSKFSPRVEIGIKNLYLTEIINFSLSHNYPRRLSVLKVNARVGSDTVQIVFFNKHYLKDFFKKNINKKVYIYGTFEIHNNTCQAHTPIVFTDSNMETVFPLYRKINTIKSGTLKKMIRNCYDELEDTFEFLPPWIMERYSFKGIVEALNHIHFPQSDNPIQVQKKKERFIYSEFLFFQLELQYIRNFFRQVPRINQYEINQDLLQTIRKNLPFELTADQLTAYTEIAVDLKREVTMQRLIQGDVGVGKTILAFIALLVAVQSGFQGAFLAPTELLAQQHFINGKKFFKSLNIEILTGSTPAKKRNRILQQLLEGSINIIFGTHALLNEKIQFKNLSMVVIDEQHRFGVSQRAALYYKGKAVDLLVTTATPIPRTMLLSLYNDLSVSVIKTKPQNRLPIITKIIDSARRHQFYVWLHKKINEGEKAYIILPLIEDSEFFTELRSIESEKGYFKKIFKGIPIGIVSGKMSQENKQNVIRDFAEGKTKVLISTTVIEVGIDVEDATFMVIENADRYGLSQLHQLRGRVGRGKFQSYCYLFTSPNITEKGKERLNTITATADGFLIAETDLKMRGGGIITGFDQSGYLNFKVGNMQDDHEIFINAQRDVTLILKDQSLQNDHILNFLSEIKKRLKEVSFS